MNSNGKAPAVIFSVNRPDALTYLVNELGLPFKNVTGGTGCFEGQKEQCWAIPQALFTDKVKEFLKEDGQLCVLHLDNQYNAWLAKAENDYGNWLTEGVMPEYLGVFKEVPEVVAVKHAGWSRFGGKYYVAGK